MKKLFVIVLAAIGMVSCMNTDEVIEVNNDNAIAFADAFIENSVRAMIDETNPLNTFNVWGYMVENVQDDAVTATVFEGKEVTSTDGTDWTYSPAQYWVPGFIYNFQALSSDGGNGWVATAEAGLVTKVAFTNNGGTEDLIYATASVEAPALGQAKTVELEFNHQLAKVMFTINTLAVQNAIAPGFTVKAEAIKMEVPQAGELNLVSGAWTVGAEKTTLEMEVGEELLTIPANYTYGIKFNVNLYKGDEFVSTLKEMTSNIKYNIEKGKAYNFVADVTPEKMEMTTIDFDTIVNEWVDNNLGLDVDDTKTVHIKSADALKAFADKVNAGETFKGKTVVLDADIDLLSLSSSTRAAAAYAEWTPIGGSGVHFEGTFDGRGHKVSNFQVNREGYAGLFGSVRATIKNLTVENVKLVANHYAGGIVGQGYAKLENCHAVNVDITVSVKELENGTFDYGDKAGAIIGQNCEGYQYVKNSTAKNVTIKGYRDLGGIAGMAHRDNTVSGCEVENITITQDLTNAYQATVPTTLGAVVGRQGSNATIADNTEANVEVGEVAIISDKAGLEAAANAGVTTIDATGVVIEGTSSFNHPGVTVIGATFKNENGIALRETIAGTFKSCVFEGSEAIRWAYTKAGETVVFENCVIKTDFRGFHFDGMAGDVLFKNCEINGFNAYGGEGTATFEGCTFGCDKSSYAGLNIYSNTVLKDCTFNFISGKTNFIDMEGTGKTLAITGCTVTLDGAAANIQDYIGGSKKADNTILIDGYEPFVEGVGMLNGVYYILNATGWNWMEAQADAFFSGKTIALGKDIDFNGAAINPTKFWDPEKPTTFDGKDFTVKNFVINGDNQSALFNGTLEVKNLKIDNATVSGNGYVAIVGGNIYGSIDNVHITNSEVTGTYWQVGGFAGQFNSGNITNCSIKNTTITGPSAVGALAGITNEMAGVRKFENCVVEGCTIKQNYSFGGNYDKYYGVATGWINIDNSNVYFTNVTMTNNTIKGAASSVLYGECEASTTVHVN